MTDYQEEIRKKAAELLKTGEVAMVIGYGQGSLPHRATPIFIENHQEVGKLVFNRYCKNNLSVYLSDLKDKGRLAIVAKPCDVRTIVNLIKEKQVERERVHIISFACPGMLEKDGNKLSPVCGRCEVTVPPLYDTLIGDGKEIKPEEDFEDALEDFEAKSPQERWEIVKAEMEKCIRCYACRNACPMCYCEECFVERTLPRWVGEGSEMSDTMIFHITRAMHSAGRCGECGACLNACPLGVNLELITRKVNQDILKLFKHRAGMDIEEKEALATFKPDDYNDFIK